MKKLFMNIGKKKHDYWALSDDITFLDCIKGTVYPLLGAFIFYCIFYNNNNECNYLYYLIFIVTTFFCFFLAIMVFLDSIRLINSKKTIIKILLWIGFVLSFLVFFALEMFLLLKLSIFVFKNHITSLSLFMPYLFAKHKILSAEIAFPTFTFSFAFPFLILLLQKTMYHFFKSKFLLFVFNLLLVFICFSYFNYILFMTF